MDNIDAKMENGVLTIDIPKKTEEEKRKNMRRIDIKSVSYTHLDMYKRQVVGDGFLFHLFRYGGRYRALSAG